jgi:hypothetical protein
MFPIRLDRTNIILLAGAVFLGVWSAFVPVPAGGFFPLVLALVIIAYTRSVYLTSGKFAALLISLIFLLVPLVLYILYHMVTSDTPASNVIHKLLPWILVLFIALVIIGLLYTLSKKVIPIVSSETTNKIEIPLILRDAKTHFSFLLEKGYKISHLDYVDHPNAGWHFQLDSPDDKVSIVVDEQRKTLLAFGKEKTDKRYQILLEAMIYYLTERKVSTDHPYCYFTPSRSQVFKHTAILLKTYIDQIENYLLDHIEITENELNNIQKQYVDLLNQVSEQRRKTKQH